MALIPAGSFTMGNCMNTNEGGADELPLHTVNVSAFYMDTNLVSYTLWSNVYQWATNHGYSFDNAGSGKAANHPVQTVNWYDVVKWCNARSEMEGLAPAYYTNASSDDDDVSQRANRPGQRLGELECERLPAADGGGVGEGGAGRGCGPSVPLVGCRHH